MLSNCHFLLKLCWVYKVNNYKELLALMKLQYTMMKNETIIIIINMIMAKIGL